MNYNDENKNKQIAYSDYLKLKNAFNELSEKYKRLKNENKELNNLLKEFQSSISEYDKAKNNINNLVNQVEDKYKIMQKKYEEQIEEIKKKDKEKKIQIIKYSISQFDINLKGNNKYKQLLSNFEEMNEKYKSLKEEYNKSTLNKLCSTSGSTNGRTNVDSKLQNYKNILLENYLNTINLGYDNNNNGNYNDTSLECEPIPSFIKCLRKIS